MCARHRLISACSEQSALEQILSSAYSYPRFAFLISTLLSRATKLEQNHEQRKRLKQIKAIAFND